MWPEMCTEHISYIVPVVSVIESHSCRVSECVSYDLVPRELRAEM